VPEGVIAACRHRVDLYGSAPGGHPRPGVSDFIRIYLHEHPPRTLDVAEILCGRSYGNDSRLFIGLTQI